MPPPPGDRGRLIKANPQPEEKNRAQYVLKRPAAKRPCAAAAMTPNGFDLTAWIAENVAKEEAASSASKHHFKSKLQTFVQLDFTGSNLCWSKILRRERFLSRGFRWLTLV